MKYSTYPKYKKSGIEWLGDVPEHWEVSKTKHPFSIQLGKMLQPDAGTSADQEVPYLKAQHVQWEKVRVDDLPTMWASQSDRTKYAVTDGDLLVCEGGDVGRAGIVRNLPADVIIQNALHRVRAKGRNDPRLLMYILEHAASQRWFEILCNRATIAHFTSEKFGALGLPLPTPTEQWLIADFLDTKTAKVDTLLSKKRTLIEKLKEKRTALISRTVTRGLPPEAACAAGLDPYPKFKPSGIEWLGDVPEHWEVKQMKWTILFQRGHDLPADERQEGDVPVVSSAGVSSRHNVAAAKGPGIVTGRYGTIGQFHLVGEDYWPLNTTLYSVELRGNQPRFLVYMLHHLSPLFLLNAVKSAVPGVDRNDLHPTKTSIPSLFEQCAIANYLDRETAKIDRLIEKVQAAIDKLQEYRAALITAAVTGKIDVRGLTLQEGAT